MGREVESGGGGQARGLRNGASPAREGAPSSREKGCAGQWERARRAGNPPRAHGNGAGPGDSTTSAVHAYAAGRPWPPFHGKTRRARTPQAGSPRDGKDPWVGKRDVNDAPQTNCCFVRASRRSRRELARSGHGASRGTMMTGIWMRARPRRKHGVGSSCFTYATRICEKEEELGGSCRPCAGRAFRLMREKHSACSFFLLLGAGTSYGRKRRAYPPSMMPNALAGETRQSHARRAGSTSSSLPSTTSMPAAARSSGEGK